MAHAKRSGKFCAAKKYFLHVRIGAHIAPLNFCAFCACCSYDSVRED